MIVIRIEGASTELCSYAWYFSEPTLFLYGLCVGVLALLVWQWLGGLLVRLIWGKAHG
jgi:hypothetical protein